MPKQYLDYQYVDGELSPFYYVIELSKGEVNWDKNIFYFDLITPILSTEYSEINEFLFSYNVSSTDLILNKEFPHRLGINLRSLKKRIYCDIHDPNVIEQFIMYAPDVEMILNQIPSQRTMSLLLNKGGDLHG